jgi:hypothetical protein
MSTPRHCPMTAPSGAAAACFVAAPLAPLLFFNVSHGASSYFSPSTNISVYHEDFHLPSPHCLFLFSQVPRSYFCDGRQSTQLFVLGNYVYSGFGLV